MHDINRTQLETGWETGLADEYAYEGFESDYEDPEYEAEYEDSEYEMYPETDGEMDEYEGSYDETMGPLSEADEMELAAELLEISDEQELDQFIGKIFSKVKKAIGAALPPDIRNSLGGIAKGLAKKLLPAAGVALGNFFAPGIGGAIGGKLASLGTQAFGLELEGLSTEDQEFEIARRYTRLVGDAAQEATFAPSNATPQATAQQAVVASAQKHAPGLVAGANGQSPMQRQSGYGQERNRGGRRGNVRVVRLRPYQKLLIIQG